MNIIYKDKLIRGVRNDFKYKISTYKWLIILSIFFFVNSLTLTNLILESNNLNLDFNIWDYILSILNNSNYYIYFFVPLSVLVCIDITNSNFEDISLIRYNSIEVWIVNKLISIHLTCFIFIIGLVITILISSFNVTYEMEWSSFMYNTEYIFNKEVLTMITPLTAVIYSIVHLVFSISFFSICITFGYIYIHSKIFNMVPAIIIWIITIFSVKSNRVLLGNSYLYLENILVFSKSVNLNEFGFFISMFFFMGINIIIFILSNLKLNSTDLYIGDKYE